MLRFFIILFLFVSLAVGQDGINFPTHVRFIEPLTANAPLPPPEFVVPPHEILWIAHAPETNFSIPSSIGKLRVVMLPKSNWINPLDPYADLKRWEERPKFGLRMLHFHSVDASLGGTISIRKVALRVGLVW